MNQIMGSASYTQTKNAQGIWINSLESNLAMAYAANGDLLATKDLIDNSGTTASNFDANGMSKTLQLDAITAVKTTRNSRQKLITAVIAGVILNFERDAAQRTKRVILSNNNRVFSYAYDTASNLLSIADNWGNKLSFSFVNGVREDTYTHANLTAQSALSLKSLDPEYFDSLQRYNMVQAMRELASLKSETTTLALRAATALSSLFADDTRTVNFYGQSLAVENKGIVLLGAAHAAFGYGIGKSPLKCQRDGCQDLLDSMNKRCSWVKHPLARAACYGAARATYWQCMTSK
jgi:YD repeat-containing protein